MLCKAIVRSMLPTHFRQQVRTNKAVSLPPLTKELYKVKRGLFGVLSDKDVNYFQSIVGTDNVSSCQEELLKYNTDFLRRCRGDSKLILKPGSAKEIALILQYCDAKKLAVCPHGGNTGTVGGSVPIVDEIILSVERLNKVLSVDNLTGALICESGCMLEDVENEANDAGLVVPVDLGIKSCQMGGVLSTNAGGFRLLRYGNLHGSCMGVEAVTANGHIVNLMSDYKRDNTGYHLKHLFIGSEGTLGVITKLGLLCPPMSKSVQVVFLGLSSMENALQTFLLSQTILGEIQTACELMDEKTIAATVQYFKLKPPVTGQPYYMMIEVRGACKEHNEQKMQKFLEVGKESGKIAEGAIASEPNQVKEYWGVRERVSAALNKDGYCLLYDISVPLRRFYDIVKEVTKRVGSKATRVCGFGHMGDANLHLAVTCSSYNPDLIKILEPFVYECVRDMHGSVGGGHGLGFLKRKYLTFSKKTKAIDLMEDVKEMMDPNFILNPYKVLSNVN